MAEPGSASGAIELEAQCLLTQTAAMVGEEELGFPPRARVRQRATL